MSGIEVIPNASRLVESLRGMPYDASQAVADIVDNSIEAGASIVRIDLEFEGGNSWIRIADNGKGMKPGELREAMRYGAEREYEEHDLGKFGLGLKTASMSQCQHLSVASRWNKDRADVAAYAWSLAHLKRTNKWEILPVEQDDDSHSILREPLADTTGTVVLWQRLDRILNYKHRHGEVARKRLLQICRDIEIHLAMVFHRFLSGEVPRKRLRKILLNGNEIKPWDPFCRAEKETRRFHKKKLEVETEGKNGAVLLEPFVLPREDKFSSQDAFRAATGPAKWNLQQGFYVYREGRMIQSGGWSGLQAPDEHLKLARIAVTFPRTLDDSFKLDVPKMRVQLPTQLRELLADAVGPVKKAARVAYGRNSKSTPGDKDASLKKRDSGSSKSGHHALTLQEWSKLLLAKTTRHERPVVATVLERLKQGLRD